MRESAEEGSLTARADVGRGRPEARNAEEVDGGVWLWSRMKREVVGLRWWMAASGISGDAGVPPAHHQASVGAYERLSRLNGTGAT